MLRLTHESNVFGHFLHVSFIFACCSFIKFKAFINLGLFEAVTKISSTDLFQNLIPSSPSLLICFLSNSDMKIFANRGPKGDAIATPSI